MGSSQGRQAARVIAVAVILILITQQAGAKMVIRDENIRQRYLLSQGWSYLEQNIEDVCELEAQAIASWGKVDLPRYEAAVEMNIDFLEAGRKEKLDMYYPANAKKGERFPGIVIIHGGGWTGGDKYRKRERNIGTNLARTGYVCISINYKLIKGKPIWPQNLYDCKNAVRFLRKYADKYHVDANNIGAIGGSAGGHLASMLGVTGPDAGLEPENLYPGISTRVQAVVDMYGITNLLTRQYADPNGRPNGNFKDGTSSKLLGVSRQENQLLWQQASPVFHVTADDPPVLILHGTADTTVDYYQSIEFAKKLSGAGVPNELHLLKNLGHTFSLEFDVSGEKLSKDLRPLVIGFFDKHLKGE